MHICCSATIQPFYGGAFVQACHVEVVSTKPENDPYLRGTQASVVIVALVVSYYYSLRL